jgi:hypothetical protein
MPPVSTASASLQLTGRQAGLWRAGIQCGGAPLPSEPVSRFWRHGSDGRRRCGDYFSAPGAGFMSRRREPETRCACLDPCSRATGRNDRERRTTRSIASGTCDSPAPLLDSLNDGPALLLEAGSCRTPHPAPATYRSDSSTLHSCTTSRTYPTRLHKLDQIARSTNLR